VHAKTARQRETQRERKRERETKAPSFGRFRILPLLLLRITVFVFKQSSFIIMSLPNVSEWFKPRIQTRPTLEKALESSSRLDEESVFNLQILTHLRSKLEFRESAEVFLREAREKMLLPRRMDANGFEREMSVWEMEAKFGMTRNDGRDDMICIWILIRNIVGKSITR